MFKFGITLVLVVVLAVEAQRPGRPGGNRPQPNNLNCNSDNLPDFFGSKNNYCCFV